ncbi:MAG: alkaline phosphatase D family protein [Verrucomicrobia bacterium]|nr:alkaline phosphatase D family protein [Verrucomicrobiota bacterium]MDA1068202.1 alkaline phosphatase D family protein [Verrucomicrobiota bacterium]
MSLPYYCLSDSHLINRRKFLRYTGSLAAAAAWSSCTKDPVLKNPSFPAYPFQLGVASGDPSPDGMVLWTRLAPLPLEGGGMPMEPVEVSWQVADDEAFSKVVQKGTTVAVPDWGHSVHVELKKLLPDRWYYYQFKVGNETSPVGRTRTMPVAGSSPGKLNFAFASCQHYETGYYTAYEHMIREDLDLIVHLGDYIYEGKGIDDRLRKHTGEEIMSVEDYRNRYALYKSDQALQAAHAAAPWLVTWDDHEVDNNYANAISEQPEVSSEELLQRRANAYKAYYEVMPLRRAQLPRGPDMQLYRRVPFGNLADFFVLDTRQYRTDQPCGDKNKPPCPDSLNPGNTLLGRKQKDWLMSGMETSKAQWNVLAQQVMMARVDRTVGEEVTHSMDQWPSAEMERRQLVKFFDEAKISNPVVLTGDIHSNWANELIVDAERLDSKSVATEFVGTSISSGGDGKDQPATVSQLLSENPFVKYHNTERGYVSCQVTQHQWTTHYRTVPYVTRQGAPLNTRASFVVESGRPQLNRA